MNFFKKLFQKKQNDKSILMDDARVEADHNIIEMNKVVRNVEKHAALLKRKESGEKLSKSQEEYVSSANIYDCVVFRDAISRLSGDFLVEYFDEKDSDHAKEVVMAVQEYCNNPWHFMENDIRRKAIKETMKDFIVILKAAKAIENSK